MHSVVRAIPLALGLWASIGRLQAQAESWPAIFAPRENRTASEPARPAPSASAPVSGHMRALINAAATQALQSVPVADGSPLVEQMRVDPTTGTTVMAPMVVRARTLQESQVRPPEIRLLHFRPLGGDMHRRLAGGVTGALYHTFIGQKEFQADFSVLNGAGNGIDHNIDFTRVELSFTLKW